MTPPVRNQARAPEGHDSLCRLLDRECVGMYVGATLRQNDPSIKSVRVDSAEVLRHKPERRAVISYRARLRRTGVSDVGLDFVAKWGARGVPEQDIERALVRAGFGADAVDGVSIASPLGVIPELSVALFRRVFGAAALSLMTTQNAKKHASTLGYALRKLHRSGLTLTRQHSLDDELQILQDRLWRLETLRPRLASRARRLWRDSLRLARRIRSRSNTLIHRDFHPDQALIAPDRIFILDFDLAAMGDPALDVGNAIAHLVEYGVRTAGDGARLASEAAALEDSYLTAAGPATHQSIWAYTLLALARLTYLSTQYDDRLHTTESMFDECERRITSIDRSMRFVARPRGPSPRVRDVIVAFGLAAAVSTSVPGQGVNAAKRAPISQGPSVRLALMTGGVYDNNIDHSQDPLASYGRVLGGELYFASALRQPWFETRYQVASHEYSNTAKWDRVSQRAEATVTARVGRRLTMRSVGVASLKGSSEDRALGDEFGAAQEIRFRLAAPLELIAGGVYRLRRYSNDTLRNASNGYVEGGVRLRRRGLQLELTERSEQNRAVGDRHYYRRRTTAGEVTIPLTPSTTLEAEVKYRRQRYNRRLVEVDNANVPRRDQRLQPQLVLKQALGSRLLFSLEYEFERRISNDPDKAFRAHRMGAWLRRTF